jgi:hypothetical protein
MYHKQYSVLWIFVVVLLSCQSTSKKINQRDLHIINFDNIEQKQGFLYSSLFDSVKVIALSSEDVTLSKITKMETYGSYLVILDSYQAKGVYLFDLDGNFLRRYGNVGFGPEEYHSCDDFTIDESKSELYIYDKISKRALVFNLKTGAYIKTLDLKNAQIDRIRVIDGKLYGVLTNFHPSWYGEENPYILKELSMKDGKVLNQWFKMDSFNKGWPGLLSETSLFYKIDGGKELFSYGLSDSILCFDRGKIYPYLVMEGERIVNVNDFNEKERNISEITDVMERTQIELDMMYRLGNGKEKILFVSDIFLKGSKLYFQCQLWGSRYIVYDTVNGSLEIFINRNDDVFFKERPSSMILPQFKVGNSKGVFYEYSLDMLYQLSFFYEKDMISNKVRNKEALKNINEDSNPVILYYEFK